MTELGREILENGVELRFVDGGNRYFGDYHRLRIEVRIEVKLPEDDLATDGFWRMARQVLGERLTLVRPLERMGVAGDQVEAVRQEMIRSYLQHAAPYLGRPQAVRSLVAAELGRRRTGRPYG